MHQSYAGTIKSTQARTSHSSAGLLVIPAPKVFLALLPIQPVVPSLLLDFVVPSFPDLLRLPVQSGFHCSLHLGLVLFPFKSIIPSPVVLVVFPFEIITLPSHGITSTSLPDYRSLPLRLSLLPLRGYDA